MERPTVREFHANRGVYPDWQLCPVCHGGRGELVEVEEGELVGLVVQDCSRCRGEKVIRRA